MKTIYRAAVIGLGRMGSSYDDEVDQGGAVFLPYCHAPSYHAAPRVELVAGADPHEEQRALFGSRWNVPSERLYADYRDMLEKEKPDMVSVCTTARLRARIVQDAARAGVRAIWAEKPIALTLAEGDAMVRTCREHGVALAINCARRWNPFFHTARNLIDQGELGDILQVNGYNRCGLSHNGSHLIDIVRYMAGGHVRWVYGEMESDEAAFKEEDLTGNGYLAFDNGVRAFIRGMSCGVAQYEVDVIGTLGRFRSIAGSQDHELTVYHEGCARNRGVPARIPVPMPAYFPATGLTIVDDLISCMENGHTPRCSGEDGLEAFEVAVALRESHRRGGVRVALPLADRSLGILSAEIKGDEVPARIRRLQAQKG
jgi:predicted dehydrogenase